MSETPPELLWKPNADAVAETNIAAFQFWLRRERNLEFDGYGDLWRWSVGEPADFWEAVRSFFEVSFASPARSVLDSTAMPGTSWFPGAQLNYAGQLLSHDDGGTALIALHEQGPPEEWSRQRLAAEVAGFAAHLRAQGVRQGDRVVAYLSNVPEAIVAFLGAASVGAVFAICGPEFGFPSVVARFAPLEPAVLVATTGYTVAGRHHDRTKEIGLLRAALPSLRDVVVVGGDGAVPDATAWTVACKTQGDGSVDAVPFDHPLWVLFSSGTTGTPKGIVHGHGGVLLEHLKYLGLHVDLRAGDRFFWYTSTSWMVWNVVVSGLLTGATIVLYDGSPTHPSPDKLWQIVADHRVTVFGASAAYLHTCAKAGLSPAREHGISELRALHSTGSPLAPYGFRWANQHVGEHVPLSSSSGGTDVATAFLAGNPLTPVWLGEIPGPCLGVDVQAWDTNGRPVVGEVGELVITSPMPSMPLYFWNDPDGQRYRSSYFDTFPGVWRHGDWVEFTARGGAVIHGRSDATLNRMGIRIGTAEIYQAVERLEEVNEALAVGVESRDGSYWLPLFVVLAPGYALDDSVKARINEAIRQAASPRHVPDDIIAIPAIPHTLTGKKLEVPIKRALLGMEPGVDPGSVDRPDLFALFADLWREVSSSDAR